jgi:S-adenosylmethionine:tRNA ribosyltransferase-isomerase
MIAASTPVQRPRGARLLVADSRGRLSHRSRADLAHIFRPGDLVIANDAATLPASLSGRHLPTGREIEVRLAGRNSLARDDVRRFSAIVFGEGDFRTRTEDRSPPPALEPGDRLLLGPLHASIVRLLGHPRFVLIEFDGSPSRILEGIARHGRPIQYSHVPEPLAVWDTWTPIAGPPVAFEPPSAAFALSWNLLGALSRRGVRFQTITHAAGISSTGDLALDTLLPFDEPYRISPAAARAIEDSRTRRGRIIAVGTTVVRALEHAAARDGVVRAGESVATQRIGPATCLRVVDAILSGTHEPGTSHYELLRAFGGDATLAEMDREMNARTYRAHEFGDSVFVEKAEALANRCAA